MTTKTNPSSTLNLLGVLFLVIGLGGSYRFVVPQLLANRTSLAKDQAINAGLKQDVSDLQGAQRRLDLAKVQLANEGVDLNVASQVVPETEDMPSLYIQMESLMTAPGISKASYQLGEPAATESGTGVKIPVALNGTGTYPDVKLFINRLQKNIRPITMDSISFSVADSSKNDGLVTFSAAGFIMAQSLSPAYSPLKK